MCFSCYYLGKFQTRMYLARHYTQWTESCISEMVNRMIKVTENIPGSIIHPLDDVYTDHLQHILIWIERSESFMIWIIHWVKITWACKGVQCFPWRSIFWGDPRGLMPVVLIKSCSCMGDLGLSKAKIGWDLAPQQKPWGIWAEIFFFWSWVQLITKVEKSLLSWSASWLQQINK